MPATKKQMRAAGRELRLRREGKVKQEPPGKSSRPFGVCSEKNLRKFAQSIDKEIDKLKGRYQDTGSPKHATRLMRAIRQKRREYGE